jgi:MoaA/NifB/PqqE/SkfB family radical SAM enzyme
MDVINALLVLPNLKTVHIISNGLLPDRLFAMLKEVRLLLNSRNVRLGLTLSIDGYGSVHEKVRGVPNCFNRTLRILDEFKNAPSLYFDYFVIGCTISKYNIEYIRETETFLSLYPFQVYYHLAVPNKRIGTFENADYSVLTDELSTLLATEYYYTKWTSTSIRKQFITKFNYFANYYYLLHGGNGRLASCIYRYRDITITENLDVALCATASDVIGNLNKNEISQIMSKNNLRDIEKCTFKNCKSCIHYTDFPTIRGLLIFLYHFYLNRKKWGRMYK